MNVTQMQRACREEIERAYKLIEEEHGIEIPRVPVIFCNRLKKCGGKATFKKLCGRIVPHRIKLSMPILQMNPEEFIAGVPGHEAAHIAATTIWGHDHPLVRGRDGSGHGSNWRGLMKLIGRTDEQFHSMKTVSNIVNVYCGCGEHPVTKQKRGKIRNGTSAYRCKTCRQRLTLRPTQAEEPSKIKRVPTRTEPRGMWTPPAKPAPAPVKKSPVVKGKTGVSAVCAMLKVFKKRGIALTDILEDAKVLAAIAAQADITGADARKLINSNWSRI